MLNAFDFSGPKNVINFTHTSCTIQSKFWFDEVDRSLPFLFVSTTSHCFCFWTSRNKTTRKCNLRSSQQQKQWWWRWWQEVVNKLDNSLKKKKAHQLFWSSQLCSTWKSAGSSSSTVRSPQLLLLLLLFKIILTSSVGWTENFRQTI